MGRNWSILCFVLTCVAAPGLSAAAPDTCVIPQTVEPAHERPAPAAEISRTQADYYVLAMTWSPEWCRERAAQPSEKLQCRDNSFGFVLHGLWPSATKGAHPRYCNSAPPLSVQAVRRNLCMTPSSELLQHEWAAHGTCGWTDADGYYDQARQLWMRFRRPEPTASFLNAGSLRSAFEQLNPGLKADAIQVRVSTDNRLLEVGICLNKAFEPRQCPGGVGTPDNVFLRITPRQ